MNSTYLVPIRWFKRWGWLYRPVHLVGWIVTIAAFAFLVQIFLALDAQSHSVTDMLYHFYVYAVPTFLGLMWIGERASGEQRGGA